MHYLLGAFIAYYYCNGFSKYSGRCTFFLTSGSIQTAKRNKIKSFLVLVVFRRCVLQSAGPPPRQCAIVTQLLSKNDATVASHCQLVFDLTCLWYQLCQASRSRDQRVTVRPTFGFAKTINCKSQYIKQQYTVTFTNNIKFLINPRCTVNVNINQ